MWKFGNLQAEIGEKVKGHLEFSLIEEKLPTYFISSEEKIISRDLIQHYNFHTKN